MNLASTAGCAGLARDPSKKLVLFRRDFRAFTGGHLKVWDYFNHVAATSSHEPRISFSSESKWDSTNPWSGSRDYVVEWQPEDADVLFLAGTDWRILPELERKHYRKPIVNLIQHPRHAEPQSELRRFLKNHAVRVCVSEEVAQTIKATNEVNGPVFVIPNGIDIGSIPQAKPWRERSIDVLICGLKAPALARELLVAIKSEKRSAQCLTDRIPRTEYLAKISDSKITVFLPRSVEGFYLPALEGMACGTIVVCPDCVGNRSFCQDTVNCFRPQNNATAILAAVRDASGQSEIERIAMEQNAELTARKHSLEAERASFTPILTGLDELWTT